MGAGIRYKNILLLILWRLGNPHRKVCQELHGGTTVIMYKLGDGMGSDPNAPKEMTPEEKEEAEPGKRRA